MNEIVTNTTATSSPVITREMRECDILSENFKFNDKIQVATEVATSLKKVITEQKLSIPINNNDYITVEGWETLGTMLGCTPVVEKVIELPTNNNHGFIYEATCCIMQGDRCLSRATAIAVRNNKQKDRPSVYSMAQTRALGKAYRMAFSWIVKLAGYEPTPAEEMEAFMETEKEEESPFERAKAKATRKKRKNTDDITNEEIIPEKVE